MLAQLAWSRILLAFDFDGTLAPIVVQRDNAQMRQRTGELLAKVCTLYPCAVISGRSQGDVGSRISGSAVKYVVGNHGVEPGAGLGDFEQDVSRAREALEQSLAGWAGVEIENKQYSLAIHYRKSRNKQLARSAIHSSVSVLPVNMRIVPGKLVVNIVPERAPNKGDALLNLRASEHADTALYVGDDVTDEDVFKLDQPGRLLSVRVGESKCSAAGYFLRDQKEIDRLLGRLVALRGKRSAL